MELVGQFHPHIQEVYYGLPDFPSGRLRVVTGQDKIKQTRLDLDRCLSGLRDHFPQIQRNLLFNALCNIEDYHCSQPEFVDKYLTLIDEQVRHYQITSVTLVDIQLSYFIKKAFPQLKIHAGVNLFAREPRQLDYLSYFDVINFDREINRDLKAIKRLRQAAPQKAFKILLNEGCMPRCTNRIQCISKVSARTREINDQETYNICQTTFLDSPWTVLQSPVVRPEDLHHYQNLGIDYWKIATRITPTPMIAEILSGYINRSYINDYYYLIESPARWWLSKRYHLYNNELPDDFFSKTSHCQLNCERCGYCKNIFLKCSQPKQP